MFLPAGQAGENQKRFSFCYFTKEADNLTFPEKSFLTENLPPDNHGWHCPQSVNHSISHSHTDVA